MTYGDTVQSWRDFYVTVGAAAATLVGLLFVGLSLHIRVVVSQADVKVWRASRSRISSSSCLWLL